MHDPVTKRFRIVAQLPTLNRFFSLDNFGISMQSSCFSGLIEKWLKSWSRHRNCNLSCCCQNHLKMKFPELFLEKKVTELLFLKYRLLYGSQAALSHVLWVQLDQTTRFVGKSWNSDKQSVKRWCHLWGYVSREMAAKRVNELSWAQNNFWLDVIIILNFSSISTMIWTLFLMTSSVS